MTSQAPGHQPATREEERQTEISGSLLAEAEARLTKPREFPGYLKKRFGGNLLEQLNAIITHPDIAAIDLMVIGRELDLRAVLEYATVLDEVQTQRKETLLLAEEMAYAYAWGTGKNEFQRAISKGFNLGTGELENYGRSIVKILEHIDSLYQCLLPEITGQLYQVGLLQEFLITLYQVMILHIYDGISHHVPEAVRGNCYHNFRFLCTVIDRGQAIEALLEPDLILEVHNHTATTIKNNRAVFNQITSRFSEETDEFWQEVKEKYERIRALSNYRKVDSDSKKIGGCTIQIIGDNEPQARAQVICDVKIIFDGSGQEQDRTINLWLNRATGELVLNGTRIAFRYVTGVKNLEDGNLQLEVYDLLIAHLEAKNEDVEPCDIPPLRELAPEPEVEVEQQLTVRVALHEVVGEEEAATAEDFVDEQAQITPEEATELTLSVPEVDTVPRVTWDQVLIPKGGRLRRTLIRILGEPLRISGSHHIFRSLREDVGTYPINLKDGETVAKGLLQKCCGYYGITPAMLKEEL